MRLRVQVPRLSPDDAPPQTTSEAAAFFGSEGAQAAEEWDSADWLRQASALVLYCQELAVTQHTAMTELESRLRTDGDAAAAELSKTKAEIPREEERVFDELRARAT